MTDAESGAARVIAALDEIADPDRALRSAWFFKTGPGEYGEGDRFIGVTVPQQRAVVKRFRGISASAIDELLASGVHEHRLTGLLLLAGEFERADADAQEVWVRQYRAAIDNGRVNNWDLVDASAATILGEWLWGRGDHTPLTELAADTELWHRRVGVVATHAFIRRGDADAILAVLPIVLDDRRDLIQKALGWMLREMGKRVDRQLLRDTLEASAADMGRTALSYATEHLTKDERAHYRSLR